MEIPVNQYHFDVFNFVKKAKELGMNENLAEYQARQIEQAIDNVLVQAKQEVKEHFDSKELSTKGDLRETELRLQKEIQAMRVEMAQIEYRLLKWMIGVGISTVIVGLGGTFTILKVMLHI